MLELTTLAKVKTLLKSPDPNLDPLITDLIKSYSKAAAGYCARNFEHDIITEYHDGGTAHLFLKRKPVIKITGIWVDDDWNWGNEDLIPATDYRLLNAKNGIVAYKYGIWATDYLKGTIKVTYEGGYDEAPDDLEMAIRTQVAYKIKRREDVGLTAVSFPDGSVQKRVIDEFLPEVKVVLDRYNEMIIG